MADNKLFRVSPDNHRMVQVKVAGVWFDLCQVDSLLRRKGH